MNQKSIGELNNLLEGIASKIGEFTEAVKGSTKSLDEFSKSIDSKIGSLNDSISKLTDVIKEADEELSNKLHDLMEDTKGEIRKFKEEVQISDIKETLTSLKKLVKIPEKQVINKTVDKVMKEVLGIVEQIKSSR